MTSEEELRVLEFEYNDQKLDLYINKPRYEDLHGAQMKKAIVFQQNIEKGLYLKKQMDKILREKGEWDDDLQDKLDEATADLRKKLELLDAGDMRLSDAKKLALEVSDLRNRITILTASRQNFANLTADGIADQAELDYLVAACTVYNSDRKTKYFKNYEDYLDRKNDDDAYIITQRFAEIMYNYIFDDSRLPENQFLKEYGFVDDKLRFINKDKHLVDIDGNLVNELGQRIEYIDGEPTVIEETKRKPFLDDDGNPIVK